MDLTPLLNIKKFYRVTGTPENFLTAYKYMTWGFNENNVDNWKKIMPGDVVFFHSKRKDSLFVKNPPTCIIGFGIVADLNLISKELLWIDEFQANKCIYPYRFKFSEFYTFGEIPDENTWDSQSLNSKEKTIEVINILLNNSISLSLYPSFPKMGSYSTVKDTSLIKRLINVNLNLDVKLFDTPDTESYKGIGFEKIDNAIEGFRYGTSLLEFDQIKKKLLKKKSAQYTRNSVLLEKAETAHFNTLESVLKLFKMKGYDTYYNKHIDLFAHNDDKSFLVEVKSIGKNNRISQARKGMIQLYEYDHFEVNKYVNDNQLVFKEKNKLLVTSELFKDKDYAEFMKLLDIKLASFENDNLLSTNNNYNFNTL